MVLFEVKPIFGQSLRGQFRKNRKVALQQRNSGNRSKNFRTFSKVKQLFGSHVEISPRSHLDLTINDCLIEGDLSKHMLVYLFFGQLNC